MHVMSQNSPLYLLQAERPPWTYITQPNLQFSLRLQPNSSPTSISTSTPNSYLHTCKYFNRRTYDIMCMSANTKNVSKPLIFFGDYMEILKGISMTI